MTEDDDLGSAPTIAPTQRSEPSASGGSPPASLLANRYEILGLLGAGGMGRVYRAHDRKLDEIVALKLLRRELVDAPGMLERFLHEVKLARRVTSPHVVRTFDLGEHEQDHFLTMEYIDGHSLARSLDGGALAADQVLRIARAACTGIAAAHEAGVLHRDLKPDNILVARTGRIAITDFGIARAHSDPSATSPGLLGTPAYMAPEQLQHDQAIGPPADVYAFGAIIFEMLTGRRPFLGSDPFAVALARLHEPPPDPRTFRDVSDPLASLVLRCLARDPAARYSDGSALGAALASITGSPATDLAIRAPAAIPGKTSRAVALLPLRATGELVEIAEGLSEEIVDALTMTRELRVRPLAAVRRAQSADQDPRQLGKLLDVDVVVEGSIRQRGEQIRITARAIGVVDGFQLWASHFDTAREGLLVAGDDVARAIARALTVEIEIPERAIPDPRAVELYLEAKAKLRANWFGDNTIAIAELESALELAPDDPGILATLAIARARAAFFGADGIARARLLAERAVNLEPRSGEAWLALGLASLYSARFPEAGRALMRAVVRAPGLALAQTTLGGLLLDANAEEDALAHLEAAARLDPGGQLADLPRAHVYAGRYDECFTLLENDGASRHFAADARARFRTWRGETSDAGPLGREVPADLVQFVTVFRRIRATAKLAPGDREELEVAVRASNVRMRASRGQFAAELLAFAGDLDGALANIEDSVAHGLQDSIWMERCPLLEPLRRLPRFRELAVIVAERAAQVIRAVREARSS